MADNIFDFNIGQLLFHEAEGDEGNDGSDIINGGDAASNQGEDSPDDGGDDNEFDVDTSVDDEGGEEGDEGGNDDNSGGDDSSSSDSGGSFGSTGGGGSGESDGEVIPQNTDIFATLTAEEQQIKIMELKKLYNDLYTYTDDLLKKMNDLDVEEDTLEVISRTSSQLYQLKIYLKDYMINTFKLKSFFDNDIFFNRFASIIYSIGKIVDRLAEKRREKLGTEEEDK